MQLKLRLLLGPIFSLRLIFDDICYVICSSRRIKSINKHIVVLKSSGKTRSDMAPPLQHRRVFISVMMQGKSLKVYGLKCRINQNCRFKMRKSFYLSSGCLSHTVTSLISWEMAFRRSFSDWVLMRMLRVWRSSFCSSRTLCS